MKRIENFINFSQHRATVEGGCGRSSVTDNPFRKTHQFFVKLPRLEGGETKMNLSEDKKCGIESYNTNTVTKDVDMKSTSDIATPTKQMYGAF